MESTHATAAVVIGSVFMFLACFVVGLRQYAQSLKGNPFSVDAILTLAGLVVIIGLCSLSIYGGAEAGLGWPARKLMGPVGITFQKVVYAGQILWITAITLIRLSLLTFYRRVFPLPEFLLASTTVIIFTIAFFLEVFIGTLAGYKWNQPSQTHLGSYPSWLLANAIINMVLDVTTLCLPLFVIRTLRVSLKRKVILAGIFCLGFICVGASIVRAVYFVRLSKLQQRDRSFSTTTYYCFIWSTIEPCISIIAACLPASAPLINSSVHGGFGTWIRSFKSLFSTARSRGEQSKQSGPGSSPNQSVHKNSNEAKFTWRAYQGGHKSGFEMESNAYAGDEEEGRIGVIPDASDAGSVGTRESRAPRVSQGI